MTKRNKNTQRKEDKISSLLHTNLHTKKKKQKRKQKQSHGKESLPIKQSTSSGETELSKPSCCKTSLVHDDHAPPLIISFLSCSFPQHPFSTTCYHLCQDPHYMILIFISKIGKLQTNQILPPKSSPRREK